MKDFISPQCARNIKCKKYPKYRIDILFNDMKFNDIKLIKNIDGFLIGGASQDAKKFIDIIKKTYN